MEFRKFSSESHKGEYLNYIYSCPDIEGKLPLVFYIHGAGSRGNDISLLASNSALTKVISHVEDKCIIVAPQCHSAYWFDLYELLCEFINNQRNAENVDLSRVYIIGSSMGGYTTWQLLLSHTDWFTAAVPICGGGMYWAAANLKDMPIWAFHGVLDNTVPCEETVKMVRAINRHGGKAKVTILPNAQHDSWNTALSEEETFEWLLAQRK